MTVRRALQQAHGIVVAIGVDPGALCFHLQDLFNTYL